MAGALKGVFKEKWSPFLQGKFDEARRTDGENSIVARIMELQYLKNPLEETSLPSDGERRRHYEADMPVLYQGAPLKGIERLYRRVILIEPTMACAAHCRWCLRGQYPLMNLSVKELEVIAQYCGDSEVNEEVHEVLVTGGDPLMVPDRLDFLINALLTYAPNIRIVRVGSRVPIHDPERVNDAVLYALRKRDNLSIELGTHVNHATELFPEVRTAFQKLQDIGVTVYNQSVLLKGVNDSPAALVNLFDELRYLRIEPHYLFHCIPMSGMHHHRTSLNKGLRLISELNNSGVISGRCKPMFTAMTDIGKISLYDEVILEKKGQHVLLQSQYAYEDRLKWNPRWQLPKSACIDERGRMRVWYLDDGDDC